MVRHSSSVAAVATILSHVIAFSFGSLPYIDVKATLIAVSMILAGLSCGVPAGYQEVQTGAKLSFPGLCFTWNLYISVLSLKFNRWRFLIFSRAWSKNIFTSGKWSTVTNETEHQNINIRHDSNLYTRAMASPSTGAYCDSESLVKREPVRIIFQWPSPQPMFNSLLHPQCFWNMK